MTWKKGESGNPAGRPPRQRDLTEILKTAGGGTMLDIDGKNRAKKRVLARLIWEFAATGSCRMPTGEVDQEGKPVVRTLQPQSFDEWFTAVKWIFSHIDGPPRLEMDVTSDNKPVGAAPASVQGMAELLALYDTLRAREVAPGDEASVSSPVAATDRAAE